MRRTGPAADHRCYARRPPAAVELGTQMGSCLSGEYRACSHYREPANGRPLLEPEAGTETAGRAANAESPLFRRLQVILWVAAILVASIVICSYFLVLANRDIVLGAVVQSSPSPSPTSSPTPTATPMPTEPLPSPTPGIRFLAPTPSPTPYPGGSIYSLSPGAGAAGWVASDESWGNHLGDSYLYAGVYDGVTYHGMLQFDLSPVPRGATIYDAVLELSGLDAGRLGGTGVWEVRVLEEEIDDDWSRRTYQDVHNAGVQWTLPPALSVSDVGEGKTNVFALSRDQVQDLEKRLLDEHYTLSFRLDGPLAGENSVFAWDTGYGPATREQRPRLVLNVGAPPKTPIPTGSPPPTSTPTPTNTPDWVVIPSTPTPGNVVTAAAVAVRETALATTTGTATATPQYVATPTPLYIVVTNTPTPMNRATAVYRQAAATALVILTGTPTPPPQPLITATSTPGPTATPVVMWFDIMTMTPTPTTTPVPALPPGLRGKILFLSDRSGQAAVYVLDPETGRLGLLTADWPYEVAGRPENVSPDGRSFAHVQNDGGGVAQIYIHSQQNASSRQVTFNSSVNYDPVWSPRGGQLAFVSTESGNDDIYVVGTDGEGQARLTFNEWEWDKHPSWSPDGTRIVFWSNQDAGRKQLWIMNADGSGRRLLLKSVYNDWDPVWVKWAGKKP